MSPLFVSSSVILNAMDPHQKRSIMDCFTRADLAAIYLADEGLLTLCDMLSAVPQEDWPDNREDLSWLLWSFDASKIS